jgi:hypothetical protein
MSNGNPSSLPPGWAPSSLGASPVAAAQHGDTCICRACAATHHLKQLQRADHLQQSVSKLEEQVRALSFARDVERCRYLSLVIETAIKNGDREKWASATAERMSFGIAVWEAA